MFANTKIKSVFNGFYRLLESVLMLVISNKNKKNVYNNKQNMDRLVKPAKEFMKAYFLDGKEKRPSDFDDERIGKNY